MSIESIQAIKRCMTALNFGLSEKPKRNTIEASFQDLNNVDKQGELDVTFDANWHANEGPFIEVSSVIRSFGIQYTKFTPTWQIFKYDSSTSTLTVSGDNYNFSLCFN